MPVQKYLQMSGAGSRRAIREAIRMGLVKINNHVVSDPKTPVNSQQDKVYYQDRLIRGKIQYRYYLLNKPPNVITSLSDPGRRPTIMDFIKNIRTRVYPVGRLDFKSEGLIFLTNDGDLTNFIISPRNRVDKTYIVKLSGNISREKLEKIRDKGVYLEGRRIIPRTLKKLDNRPNCTILIKIHEGKKHVVRNLFQYSGHTVRRLQRTAIGTFKLGSLSPGEYRPLSAGEVLTFKKKTGFPG